MNYERERVEPNSRKVEILRAVVYLYEDRGLVTSDDVYRYLYEDGISRKPSAVRTALVRYARQGLVSREWDSGVGGYLYRPNDRTYETIRYFSKHFVNRDRRIEELEDEVHQLREGKRYSSLEKLILLRTIIESRAKTGLRNSCGDFVRGSKKWEDNKRREEQVQIVDEDEKRSDIHDRTRLF